MAASQRLALGMLTVKKMLHCPKEDTGLELRGHVWARDPFRVFSRLCGLYTWLCEG